MKLSRLLAPTSIAVVGASTRPGTYGNQALANLVAADFAGPVFGVHPTATRVHGVPCVPRLADIPIAPDAVIIATPAATVPGLVAEAGELGCGGAVVFAAGFAESKSGVALQEQVRAAALAHNLPLCGPNGNGIVSVHNRAPMWGDSCTLRRPGPIALISQSGNVAVNALGSTRALRLHTVVSCGNQAVLDAADYLTAIATMDEVRAVALYLEAEGDGAKVAEALAVCAERDIGVVVLKAGSSELGASAAAAHTGSVAGDARVLRALVEEAGGAWARNPHELLELAKALAYGRRVPGTGLAIVTCSGGDAATGADEASRLGVGLPAFAPETMAAMAEVLPPSVSPVNPLDYTALIFGEAEPTTRLVALAGRDEAIGPVLVFYDRPGDLGADAAVSWDGALAGIVAGAAKLDKPVLVAATLPELMPEATAEALVDAGLIPVAGLSEGVLCAGALLKPAGEPEWLRAVADAAERRVTPGDWLPEHEAKALLRSAGVPTPDGRVVSGPDDAARAAASIGGPVAMKLSHQDLQHKSEVGAVLLDATGDAEVRDAAKRLRAIPRFGDAAILVEAMAPGGVELMLAVRRDGAIPVLVVALGGVWVEILDDALLLPLPTDRTTVRDRLGRLRGAPLLHGGRGRPPVDVDALCDMAVRVAELALAENIDLVELNPVFARSDGVIAVDAVIRRGVTDCGRS